MSKRPTMQDDIDATASDGLDRMPRAMSIVAAQDRLAAAAEVLATPEARDVLGELAAAIAADYVLRRLRGMPPLTIQEQILRTAEFYDCGVARVAAAAVLLTERGGMAAPEPPTTIDQSLN